MIARLAAAAAAFSVTFSLVWGIAALGYPPSAAATGLVLAQACR